MIHQQMVNTRNTARAGAEPSNNPRLNLRSAANQGEERESVSHNNPTGVGQAQASPSVVLDAATK